MLTPMMEQWQRAKNEHKDAILLFRMGDFYELFGDDALKAAPLLELTLTSRDKDKSGLKMAGFPFHAADSYIEKLLDRGHKVAICDQLEDPKLSRGIVKRGITNVITPGTAIIGESSDHSALSFLMAIASHNDTFALCALDLPTGVFQTTSSASREKIFDEALRLSPKELLVWHDDQEAEALCESLSLQLSRVGPLRIEKKSRPRRLETNFNLDHLDDVERVASSLLLSYLVELKGAVPAHIGAPKHYAILDQLLMDDRTRVNLDLLPKKKGDKHNLFSVMDRTKTAMGRRLLLQSLTSPSTEKNVIELRQTMVGELIEDPTLLAEVREILASCYDLEKLTAHVASNKISPRGMARMRDTLVNVERMFSILKFHSLKISHHFSSLPDLGALRHSLENALADEPPLLTREGGIFRAGFSAMLDEFRDLIKNGHDMLLALERHEKEATQIASLKVKFTRVFGYYIEITKTHLDKVPAHYQRKQTIAGGERYVTKELSELEAKLYSAEIKALELEESLFHELRTLVANEAMALMKLGQSIACLDMVASFAELAITNSLVKPTLLDKKARLIHIEAGRHPVVESQCFLDGSYFVPNDVRLDDKDCSLMLITGPNMAGKSTIMRQVALIQVMAQMGSFIPAKKASLSICDAIFARVGASDDMATGRSTFMVEMTETAAILKNATTDSLIILDEIGRGTSTYDGVSIAQAVCEYIHNELNCRTLFATHYHELTTLAASLLLLRNFHVGIEEKTSEIRFLYNLREGACRKSFGIEVARLSGLPQTVLDRATAILLTFETSDNREEEHRAPACLLSMPEKRPQLNLFAENVAVTDQAILVQKLKEIDINRLTPLQALNKISSWQEKLRRL